MTHGTPDAGGIDAVWDRTVSLVRSQVPESTYALWLAELRPVALSAGQLRVGAPERVRSWVADRFSRLLDAAASEAVGRPLHVRLVASEQAARPQAPLAPSAHAQIRVPLHYLAHFPVERDPHAAGNWRGRGVRSWEHVGADVEIDHVSTPLHLRVVLGVAACLQGGVERGGRVVVAPEELLRAAGYRRPGGRDVRDLLRVLADWNACGTLRVTVRVPDRARGAWGPSQPSIVIDGPPARGQVVTAEGEVLDPAVARTADIASSRVAAVVLDVAPRFADLVATEDACRLVSRATLGLLAARELLPYVRHQAVAPDRGARKRYTGWPWLQQLGLHGRVDPALELHPDEEIRASALRTRQKAQRRMEQDLQDDLLRLCELDAGFAWVKLGDGGNGCAVVRVGVGVDGVTGRRLHGPRPGAESEPRLARRAWHRELVRRGSCTGQPRAFARLPRSRYRRRLSQATAEAAWNVPRREQPPRRTPPRDRTAPHGPPGAGGR
ncbi:MAG TPA: DnaA N-terminal domain-containing protein [Conexibacter sp.]|jgi:hypothetical protein